MCETHIMHIKEIQGSKPSSPVQSPTPAGGGNGGVPSMVQVVQDKLGMLQKSRPFCSFISVPRDAEAVLASRKYFQSASANAKYSVLSSLNTMAVVFESRLGRFLAF